MSVQTQNSNPTDDSIHIVIPKHPRVPWFKRRKAAEEWMRSSFPSINCDFSGCALEVLNFMLRRFSDLIEEFPEMIGRIRLVRVGKFYRHPNAEKAARQMMRNAEQCDVEGNFEDAEMHRSWADNALSYRKSLAWAIPDLGILEFNSRYFAKPMKLFLMLSAGEEAGYYPKSCWRDDYLMTHEFAHLIQYWLASCSDRISFRGQTGTAGRLFLKWHDSLPLKSAVSGRGTHSCSEFFAEAFASAYHSPEPEPVAIEVKQVVDEFVEKIRSSRLKKGET